MGQVCTSRRRGGDFSAALLLALILVLSGCGGSSATKGKSATSPTPVSHHHPVKRVKPQRTQPPKTNVYRTPLQRYSAAIFPTLNRSSRTFDNASRDAGHAGGRLGRVCGFYAARVDYLEGQADGVPHPYLWYSRVGLLHHRIMGVYHFMRGALGGCQEAVASGVSASDSIGDMSTGARDMHRLVSDVWAILHPRR